MPHKLRRSHFFTMQHVLMAAILAGVTFVIVAATSGSLIGPPPATFSTWRVLIHSSVTPGREAKPRLARSAGLVLASSRPAFFISWAAEITASGARPILGT